MTPPGTPLAPGEVKGVLVYHRVNRRKKKVRWVEDENIKQIRFFELDETERVNVNRFKHVGDMKMMDKLIEREQFMKSRRSGKLLVCGTKVGQLY